MTAASHRYTEADIERIFRDLGPRIIDVLDNDKHTIGLIIVLVSEVLAQQVAMLPPEQWEANVQRIAERMRKSVPLHRIAFQKAQRR